MSEETVKVLKDSKTMDYESVPRSQVPPGYMKVIIQGHGEFFADPRSLKMGEKLRHPPFSPAVKQELKRLYEVISCVYPVTQQQWEDGFRMDCEPWRELVIWEVIALAFRRFTAHLKGNLPGTQSMRTDVFDLVKYLINDGPVKSKVKWLDFGSVKAKRVRELHDFLFSAEEVVKLRAESDSKYRELFREEVLKVSYPHRVSIDALFDDTNGVNKAAPFDVRECIGIADLILGEDVDSKRRFLVFGREMLTRSVATGESIQCRRLTVELDQETEELQKLLALVKVIKGSHDYQSDDVQDDERK